MGNSRILTDALTKTPSMSSNGSLFANQNMGSLMQKQIWQLPQTTRTFAFVPLQPSINTISSCQVSARQQHILQNTFYCPLPMPTEISHKPIRRDISKKESTYSLLGNKNFVSRYSRTIGAANIPSHKKSRLMIDLPEAYQSDNEPENRLFLHVLKIFYDRHFYIQFI